MKLFLKLTSGLLFFCWITFAIPSFASYPRGTSIEKIIDDLGTADEVIKSRDGSATYSYFTKYRSPVYAPDSTQPRVIIAPGGHAIGVPIPQQEIGATTLILCETTYQVNPHGIVTGVRKTGKNCN